MQASGAMFAALASAAVLAGVSSLHCAAMCGPLAGCASGNTISGALRYQAGRTVGYAALGAVAGSAGSLVPATPSWIAAVVAWFIALVLLAAAFRAWRPKHRQLVTIGQRPSSTSKLARLIGNFLRRKPAIGGALTTLLPCGVLWAAVAIALSSGSAVGGAVVMATFATLTGVAVGVAAGILRLIGTRLGGRPIAVVLVASAMVFAVLPLPGLFADAPNSEPPSCPLHAEHTL